nr:peptidoglycan DD-metalloendopeptidase family protein [Pseudomonas sp. NW5]
MLLGGSVLLFGLLLGGCATSTGSSTGVESAAPRTGWQGQHRVQRGETLYSIAKRYGWDWQTLAAQNGIAPPYTLRVGQVLRLGQGTRVASTPAPRSAAASTPSRVSTPATRITPLASAPASVKPAAGSPTGWAWPASGTVIESFSASSSLNKGIDIAGEAGQPVLASLAGSVVYAGSGLRGYGELIIIKHSDTYVSAYGHNRRLLVKEGQRVTAGQQIAEMGSTDTDRVKLHFEIRRQGKPVDPLQYLPRR